MDQLLQDIRLAFRRLRKAPLFTTVAIISIALGIGANTAVFSLLDQAVLRSLPVRDPQRLVLVESQGQRQGWLNTNYGNAMTFSYPIYRDIRDGATKALSPIFDGVFSRVPMALSVAWHGQTDRVTGEMVSGNYFDVLGSSAMIGRALTPDDDRTPGAHPVVVLDYGYWKSRFGADRAVLNQTISLNGHPMTIVGIMPPSFHGVGTTERPVAYVPMMMRTEMFQGRKDLDNRKAHWLNIFARLKPGVSQKQAEAALTTFWRPVFEQEASAITGFSAKGRARFVEQKAELPSASNGISGAPEEFVSAMGILTAMVGLLLLIGCANVANLMIARGMARQKEIAIYLALGASRMRLFMQVIVESVVLSLAGGLCGVLISVWLGDLILGMLPLDASTQGVTANPDMRVLLFTLTLSVFSGILFGLAPALQSTQSSVSTTLKEQSGSVMGGGRAHMRLRKILVVAQVALSLVLLIGAGLFAYSLRNLKNIPVGYRTEHLLTFGVQPSLNGYSTEKMTTLYAQMEDNLAAIPGVTGVMVSSTSLLAGDNSASTIDVPGYKPTETERMSPDETWVNPGYFGNMGVPLITGREFTAQDNMAGPKVAVVNESMANHFYSGNAVGRTFTVHGQQSVQIIGVVRDSKNIDLRSKPRDFMYFPYRQNIQGGMTFYLRTNQDVAAVTAALKQQVASLDPDLPIFDIKTMDRQINELLFIERMVATLSVVFGTLATVLAAVGLYGVMAYLVVRRTREIGIRMALGATPGQVMKMVMNEVLLLAGIGVGVALLAWLPLGGAMNGQLFNVTGKNPGVVGAATFLLCAVALLAGFIPARRATRIEPVSALRYE